MSRIAVLLAAKLFLCTDFQVERAPMDVPKAMSILAFSGARSFESTSLPEIEKKFTMRIHALEQYKNPSSGKDIQNRRSPTPSPLKVSLTASYTRHIITSGRVNQGSLTHSMHKPK